ncbi:hypothetical protein K492DRAFT_173834 [Lichtheimia hyalospora FSU 10163]|nr:hypothetical protein K492DRAFT_173834 [Lichtheimia hyalospora FSU 10163]
MKFVSRSIVDQDKELEINDKQNEQGSDSSKPQQEYDPRTLFERLQEQRTIKEEQFQEATRLSNLIKRVDDEEAEYFESLLDVQEKLALEQRQKEQDEIAAYRKAVEQTRTTAPELPTTMTTPAASKKPSSQRRSSAGSSKKALDGLVIVKKKRNADDVESDDENKDKEEKADTHISKKAKTTGKSTLKKQDDNNNNNSNTAANTSKPASSVNTLSSLMAAYSSDSSDDE